MCEKLWDSKYFIPFYTGYDEYNGYNDTIVCHVAINETSRSSIPSIYEIVNRFC